MALGLGDGWIEHLLVCTFMHGQCSAQTFGYSTIRAIVAQRW